MRHVRINFAVVLVMLQLAGCSTFQSATFSEPAIESTEGPTFSYGDGIALKLPGICVSVREGFFSADYRNNFVGPLIFTIFPLGVFAGEHKVDFYEVDLDLVPLGSIRPITFDPTKTSLKLNDGAVLTPFSFRQGRLSKNINEYREPLVLRESGTAVSLRFKKEHQSVQMSELELGGIHQQNTKIDLPVVKFGPRSTHYRFLFSGTTQNNIPMSQPIVRKCNQ